MNQCVYCHKGPVAGRQYSRRGKLKKQGGVGRRTARVNPRIFMPNVQRAKVLLEGAVRRVLVCASCLKKNGRVVKVA